MTSIHHTFMSAVEAARRSFDPEAALRAARKLFPDLDETEQRKRSHESLFSQVLELLRLTTDDVTCYENRLTGIRTARDVDCFSNGRRQLNDRLSKAEKELQLLGGVRDMVTEVRLSFAAGRASCKSLAALEQMRSDREEYIASLKSSLENIDAEERLNNERVEAAVKAMEAEYPILHQFSRWRAGVIRGIQTDAELQETPDHD